MMPMTSWSLSLKTPSQMDFAPSFYKWEGIGIDISGWGEVQSTNSANNVFHWSVLGESPSSSQAVEPPRLSPVLLAGPSPVVVVGGRADQLKVFGVDTGCRQQLGRAGVCLAQPSSTTRSTPPFKLLSPWLLTFLSLPSTRTSTRGLQANPWCSFSSSSVSKGFKE